ncbi:phage virion morphogenesis protein [Pseudovibrio sp. Tun.PSC04-5.I4]|uniref:phage virion morphogenesis protein n=1 Tax=Pseudovibrio sp. Tun.PSC04-5.I4 TaxID=1798213 RepID=UPI000884F199|nr:phage virion morphogenesis protein [Pseudovibrio sp. Tun.PSC04-5.I4]SDR07639.1 phage virion morphogenesis (putative tail completion) protein [Pseudovibrio sp. Tun.PSC04-5.I4]
MSGVEFVLDDNLGKATLVSEAIASVNLVDVLDIHGALGVSQTQRRITQDQTAPDGSAWKGHSKGYGETRGGSQGLLHNEGDLVTSIDHVAGSDEVSWGSPVVYAAIHQFGGTIKPKNGKALFFMMGGATVAASQVSIPARPYLGLSGDDIREHEDTLIHFMGGLLS